MKHVLVDTQLLLWTAAGGEQLSDHAVERLKDENAQPLFSAASIWEIVVKSGLGRADFKVDAAMFRRGLVDNGYQELPITSAHALAVGRLPDLPCDPFDRILAAKAVDEGIELLAADRTLAAYPGPISLAG